MKIVVLYRPDSEFSRPVETFVHDYKREHPQDKVDLVNYDSRDGSSTAMLYDVMQQPAIMVLHDDGSVANIWEGTTLPLMSEVAAYAYA